MAAALARDRGGSRHPGRRDAGGQGAGQRKPGHCRAFRRAFARPAASGPGYQATIVRTAHGIPHITARNFGSLSYG